MPLTPAQRKNLLKGHTYGEIGALSGRSQGQVSEVINDHVRDSEVERVTAELIGLPVGEVFPPAFPEARRQKQIERFWSNVQKTEDCWIWTAGAHQRGYGKVRFGGCIVSAPRLSFELANGPIPLGYYICHHCDNPRCVRPDHLYMGTALENNHDTRARGHRPKTYTRVPRSELNRATRESVEDAA